MASYVIIFIVYTYLSATVHKASHIPAMRGHLAGIELYPFPMSMIYYYSSSDPCDTYDCISGYECQVYEPTGEAYCEPTCDPNPCGPQELCQITTVTCIRAPCPGILSCEPSKSRVLTKL